MLNRAIEIFQTNELKGFEVEDSFNSDHHLSGFVCMKPDYRYGALVIFKVNDEECEQVIYGTPKIQYPFDKQGTYRWPDIREIRVWSKLDGTNVFAYSYSYRSENFVTYKTRLTPVIKDSKLVSFKSMWEEYIKENDWVKRLIDANPEFNLSFEMFGFRNPITIKYQVPLEVNLLFGIRRKDVAIKPPSMLNLISGTKLPSAYGEMILSGEALTEQYNKFRQAMSEMNHGDLLIEGMVIYAHVGEPSWKLYKVKPEEIEKIHWAASGSIPTVALRNTALNTFEDRDDPTIEDFKRLLLEEYSQHMLNKAELKIQKAWSWAVDRVGLTKLVNDVWAKAKELGFDVTKDKASTMRFMSNHFPKEKMSKVGTIVLQQAGLLRKKAMSGHNSIW